MKVIQAIYMVYRPCDLYESDSSPCDINHQKLSISLELA